MEMAEATLAALRDQRQWTVFEMAEGEILSGPSGQRRVIGTDIEQLASVGLLRTVSFNPATYVIPPRGGRGLRRDEGEPGQRAGAGRS